MSQTNPNAALLVMDMQVSILSNLPNADAIVANVRSAIATARSRHIPVIYVVVGFRKGMPEVSAYNKSFTAARERFSAIDPNVFVQIHPALAPADGEVTVTKRRISAFTGSDLEVLLRGYDARHLVLTGVSTSGVVLSTTREAADKDYKITILSDCVADADEEVHRVLTTRIFPRQAEVITSGDWANSRA
jgi:nicotinamidase-related amidase